MLALRSAEVPALTMQVPRGFIALTPHLCGKTAAGWGFLIKKIYIARHRRGMNALTNATPGKTGVR